MYRIRKLEVRRFRGLAGPVTLEFGDRYHLIVGDNGAGKTNLLKLLAMVTRMDFSPLADESFDLSWEGETDGGDRVVGSVMREVLEPSHLPDPLPGQARARWRWELRATGAVDASASHSADDGPADDSSDPANSGALLRRMVAALHPHLGLFQGRSARADEALGCFEALATGGRPDSDDSDLGGFEPEVWPTSSGVVATLRMASPQATESWAAAAAAGQYGALEAEDVDWLEETRRGFGARAIQLMPRFSQRVPIGLPIGGQRAEAVFFRGADVHVSFSPHVAVHHDKLSFGQKRLLGLRYYLSTAPNAPAIIDELSNGLHHAWVESIVRELEPRQSFLATQNPLLMDAVWWDSAEEAGRGIILCTRDAEHRWVWRQLDTSDAVRFYEAWRAGVQQIHEVLKTEGWW